MHGEADCPFDLADHAPTVRAGPWTPTASIAPSSRLSVPLGIEALPPDEAAPLLDAYHDGVAELPARVRRLGGPRARRRRTPPRSTRLLDRGFVGVCVPAGALGDRRELRFAAPVLELLERRGAPLSSIPARRRRTLRGRDADGAPPWWPALTRYVAEHERRVARVGGRGRAAYPRPARLFAMLAGLAPLQRERLAARGGRRARHDPLVFDDTSSYGPARHRRGDPRARHRRARARHRPPRSSPAGTTGSGGGRRRAV